MGENISNPDANLLVQKTGESSVAEEILHEAASLADSGDTFAFRQFVNRIGRTDGTKKQLICNSREVATAINNKAAELAGQDLFELRKFVNAVATVGADKGRISNSPKVMGVLRIEAAKLSGLERRKFVNQATAAGANADEILRKD